MRLFAKLGAVILMIGLCLMALPAKAEIQPIMTKNAYAILGVATSAEPNDIQKAYRKLMMKYHPDRYRENSYDQKIAMANMQICKAAYEAIESNDESLMAFFGGTLGDNYRPTEATVKRSRNDPDWFRNKAEEMRKSRKNFREDSPTAANIEPRQKTFFDNEIVSVYENNTGLIIELNTGEFFWAPAKSKVVYPIITFGLNGEIEKRRYVNTETFMFDSRLPGGQIQLHIKDASTLRIANLTFHRSQLFFTDNLNIEFAGAGFRHFSNYKLNSSDLNLWDYYLYSDGITFTIIMLSSSKVAWSGASTKVRLFEGTEERMQEIPAYFNSISQRVEIPSKGVNLQIYKSANTRPIFDRSLNSHMGYIDMSNQSLKVFKSSSNDVAVLRPEGRPDSLPIAEIAALSLELKSKFSVARMLGDQVDPPMTLRSPIDVIFADSYTSTSPLKINGPSLHDSSLPTPAPIFKPSPADEQLRIFNEMERLRDSHPALSKLLNLPASDSRRRFAEVVLYESGEATQLLELTKAHSRESDFAFFLFAYINSLKTWDAKSANLQLVEILIDDNLDHSDILVGFIVKTLRGLMDHIEQPELRSIVLKILQNRSQAIWHHLSQAFGSERRLRSFQDKFVCEQILVQKNL